MLPSRPNASRTGAGLPSAPRSRSVGRAGDDYDRDRHAREGRSGSRPPPLPSTRAIRPQRSAANLPSPTSYSDGGRGRDTASRHAPPSYRMPSNPRARSVAPREREREREREYDDRASYKSRTSGSESISSLSSVSSSGSSFLDRMRGRSGYASSRTSLEEDADPYPPKQATSKLSSRPMTRRDVGDGDHEDEPRPGYESQESGFGSTLWSRVADAAGSLTINVSKAWAANITTFAGEETPPGQESRLTRAMKAYHLEKARDPADLPEWLFSESERRPARARRERPLERDQYEEVAAAAPSRSRGLKDIYAAAAVSVPAPARNDRSDSSMRGRYGGPSQPAPSKATDRLKAMRDAKRGATARAEDEVPMGREYRNDPRAEGERRPARVGLPSGPGVRPRRT
eukprot:PLAT9796.1.p1 GENE.PLAT9796.1~~PLAT9796.1.p1  ORF type:complete len:401 (-),score=-143.07 PLAT9796.1:59-1261(-)